MIRHFLIISTRRCGSSYLSSRLNNCPGVFCDKEFVLREEARLQANHIHINRDDFSLIEEINKNSDDVSIRGSKLTVPDYQADHMDMFIRLLDGKAISLVHIIRELAQQFISLMAVRQTNIWQVVEEGTRSRVDWMRNANQYVEVENYKPLKAGSLVADRKEAERFCRMVTRLDTAFAGLSCRNRYLRINYNDLDKNFNLVLKHLDIPEIQSNLSINSSFKKVISIPHQDLIKNWNQVSDVFDKWERTRKQNVNT